MAGSMLRLGVMLLALSVSACAAGASPQPSPSAAGDGSSPSPSPTPTATPTPVPTATAAPSEPASEEPTPFAPPSPACPAPAQAAVLPEIVASVGAASVVATGGSATVMTCSTVGTFDAVPPDPTQALAATPGDTLTLTLPAGWQFLRWEGSDRPADGDEAIVHASVDTPGRPSRIVAPVPARAGRSVATFDLWIIGDANRVVAQQAVAVLIDVE
jgi:hypothetical protein